MQLERAIALTRTLELPAKQLLGIIRAMVGAQFTALGVNMPSYRGPTAGVQIPGLVLPRR